MITNQNMNLSIKLLTESSKNIFKNLYVYYRYDLFLYSADEDDFNINSQGIIFGKQAKTHDETMKEFDRILAKPKSLIPLLFYNNKVPIGFAFVLAKPYVFKGVNYKLEEYFIMNKYRRNGIGEKLFCKLIKKYVGVWELGYLKNNLPAGKFWEKVISRHSHEYKRKIIPAINDLPELMGFEFIAK